MSIRLQLDSNFSESDFQRIAEIRVNDPDLPLRQAALRRRRTRLTTDGRLVVLAADHPGRGVTQVGDDPVAMGDRLDYLRRIVRVLSQPGVDGIMSTADILEELLILDSFRGDAPSLLDDKLMIGCLNRGGVSGTVWEMRDRFGAYSVKALAAMRLDGAKLMFRLDPANPDSGATLQDCALALRQLQEHSIPAFLEPLPVRRDGQRYAVEKKAPEMIRAVGIATALGDSCRNLWLKLPYAEEFAKVARATACPILMLGGEAQGDLAGLLRQFSLGLQAGANVRGVLVGRNVLFPQDRDPALMATAVSRVVHDGIPHHQAAQLLDEAADS